MNKTTIENRDASASGTNDNAAHVGRREMMQRIGKFSMYAAPFSLLAFTQKAQAAGSCAPGFGSCGGGSGHPTPRH